MLRAYGRYSNGTRERCAPKGAAATHDARAKAKGAVVLCYWYSATIARAKATGAVRVA